MNFWQLSNIASGFLTAVNLNRLIDTIIITYLIWIGQLKFPTVARPRYETLAGFVHQQLQQKLPQLNWAGTGETGHTLSGSRRRIAAQHRLVQTHRTHIGGMLKVRMTCRTPLLLLIGPRCASRNLLKRRRIVRCELRVGIMKSTCVFFRLLTNSRQKEKEKNLPREYGALW